MSHRLQWGSAAIDAERNRCIFMPGDPLDKRVLHPCVTKVIDQRVPETVEGFSAVSYAQLRLVTTKPFGWSMSKLAPHCLQFWEQAVCTSGSECFHMLQQPQIDKCGVQRKHAAAARVLQFLVAPTVIDADALNALVLDEVIHTQLA